MLIQKKFNIKMRDMKNTGARIPKSYIMLGLQLGTEKNKYHSQEIPDSVTKNIIKRLIKEFGENDQMNVSERNEEVKALKELLVE